eukprot:scaffold124362_cov24-Phaeocystis_antarctica.AAC.1
MTCDLYARSLPSSAWLGLGSGLGVGVGVRCWGSARARARARVLVLGPRSAVDFSSTYSEERVSSFISGPKGSL